MGMILQLDGTPFPDRPPQHKSAAVPRRDDWQDQVLVGEDITPETIQNALVSATYGDGLYLAQLAHAVERRDADLRGVLHTRRLAVTNRPWSVLPASDDARDVDIAAEATTMLGTLGMPVVLYDALDALHVGWSGQWLSWDTSEHQTRIQMVTPIPAWAWTYRPPDFSGTRLRVPRMLTREESTHGVEPHRASLFLHEPRTMSAHPTEGGLCWPVFLLYLLRSYGLRDFSSFMSKFGIPWIMTTHPGGTDIKVIEEHVRKIAQGAYGSVLSIPEGWTAELLKMNVRNAQAFVQFLDWMVHRYAYLILGQSASIEATPGRLGNDDLHAHVREDIRQFDGGQLSTSVSRNLLWPWARYEYGPETPLPMFWLHTDLPQADETWQRVLHGLAADGVPIGIDWVREWYHIPPPQEGEAILQPMMQPTMGGDDEPDT